MWATQRLVLLGAVGALFAGCWGHRPEGSAPVDGGCPTLFRIDNRSSEMVDVFLHRGVLVRLGTVSAWRSADLTSLAANAPDMRVRLIARPVAGGRSVTTDELLLGTGDHVRWTITHPLEYSSITAVIEHVGAAGSAGKCTRGRLHGG